MPQPPGRAPRPGPEPTEQVTGSLGRLDDSGHAGTEVERLHAPDFPLALRGYEREAVDRFVAHVSEVIADLRASRSPEDAVRRALDQVGEETSGILQRARETASEITARSRAQADDRLRQAEHEAREMVADAEARLRELDDDFGRLWGERDRLLGEVRTLAEQLLATADDAEERWGAYAEEAPGEETAALPAVDAEVAETSGEGAFEEDSEVGADVAAEPGEAAAQAGEASTGRDSDELDFSDADTDSAEPAPDGLPGNAADASSAGEEGRGSERSDDGGHTGHEAADPRA